MEQTSIISRVQTMGHFTQANILIQLIKILINILQSIFVYMVIFLVFLNHVQFQFFVFYGTDKKM